MMMTTAPRNRDLDRPHRLHAAATARTSLATSLLAVLAAVLILCGMLTLLSVGLVAAAEPVAMLDAVRDGLTYLWVTLVEAVA